MAAVSELLANQGQILAGHDVLTGCDVMKIVQPQPAELCPATRDRAVQTPRPRPHMYRKGTCGRRRLVHRLSQSRHSGNQILNTKQRVAPAHGESFVWIGALGAEGSRKVTGGTIGTLFRRTIADCRAFDWDSCMVQHSAKALAPFRLLEQTVRRTRPDPAGAIIFGHPGLRSRRFRVNIESLGRFDAVTFGRGDIAAIPSRRPSI